MFPGEYGHLLPQRSPTELADLGETVGMTEEERSKVFFAHLPPHPVPDMDDIKRVFGSRYHIICRKFEQRSIVRKDDYLMNRQMGDQTSEIWIVSLNEVARLSVFYFFARKF